MTTLATMYSPFLFFQRQPGLLPRRDAPAQRDCLGESVLAQLGGCRRSTGTARVAQDDRARLEPREILEAFVELRLGHVTRGRDMAGVVFPGVAEIEHHGVTAVDELHRLERADLGAGTKAARQERPDQHGAG